MSDMLKVAEGILEGDYTKETLESIDSIHLYAEACDIELTNDEAELIKSACDNWLNIAAGSAIASSHDFYVAVKKPLLGNESTI